MVGRRAFSKPLKILADVLHLAEDGFRLLFTLSISSSSSSIVLNVDCYAPGSFPCQLAEKLESDGAGFPQLAG